MRTKFKAWAEPYIKEHQDICVDALSMQSIDNLYLEIGSGKGLYLVTMAKKFPERNYVGVERNVTCAGFLAKKIVEGEVSNAKLCFMDAEKLLAEVKEHSLKHVFLNFSDPWPKKKHNKRRLTSERFIPLYQRVMAHGGEIILKTDNRELFDFSKENFVNNGFTLLFEDLNYQLDEENDALTEYEIDFRKDNNPIYRLGVRYE